MPNLWHDNDDGPDKATNNLHDQCGLVGLLMQDLKELKCIVTLKR